MIRHIVMFRLKKEKIEKLMDAAEAARKLISLDMIEHGEVVVNSLDADPTNYDLALIFDFSTMQMLETYQTHPVHIRLKEYLKDSISERACIDFEIRK